MFEWLNINQGAVMTILTFIYVITTLFIVLSNRKLRKQNSDIQRQNVRIQLFEKRYEVYKETERFFDELIKNNYSGITLFALSIADNNGKYDFDFSFSKIRNLFGIQYYEKVNKVYTLVGQIGQKIEELTNVYEYIINRLDKDGEFKNMAVALHPKAMYTIQHDDLKSLCDKYALKNIKLGFESARDYNYYNMHIEKSKLIEKFSDAFTQLLKSMEHELHINDI